MKQIPNDLPPDEVLLLHESKLRRTTFRKRDKFRSIDARRHFNEGEWRLLPGVSEDKRRGRQACSLFGTSFLDAVRSRHSELALVIKQHCKWESELADLRDPAAHRIPIYVPPAVITSAEQLAEFRRIEAQVSVPASAAEGRPISEIYREAQSVAGFMPAMIMSGSNGLTIRKIAAQVQHDHSKYLTVAEAVVALL